MSHKKKNNIYKVLYKKNRSRNIKGLFVMIALTLMIFGTLWSFVFIPVLGILTQKRFFQSEQFEKIDTFGITDGQGYIEFVDEDYNVVYPKDSKNLYTAYDIENMVNVYSIQQEVRKYNYIKDGKDFTEIIAGTYNAEYGWYVKLDSNLNYIDSANFHYIKSTYTEDDIYYIINDYIRDLKTYKYDFVSNEGDKYTMIMVVEDKIEFLELYEIIILISMAVFLVLMYTLFIVFSIRSTGRLFKRPLQDLSSAIGDLSNGKHPLIFKEYEVEEFNSIVKVYNDMVIALNEYEQQNIALNKQKQSMLANISHDLKTPVTVIQGYIDAIRSGKAPEDEINEYLNKVYSKSEYMTALINSFADFSKLNHPEFTLNVSSQNFCDIVRNYIADTYNYILDNGMEISVDIPDNDYICNVDKYHFERSLSNIISNFIKYNQKGTLIHIALYKDGEGYSLIVENNGTPIEKHIIKSIFDPLVTGDISRSNESTGLGLASAKKVIELHGGTIVYQSRNEYVNSFKITLPII